MAKTKKPRTEAQRWATMRMLGANAERRVELLRGEARPYHAKRINEHAMFFSEERAWEAACAMDRDAPYVEEPVTRADFELVERQHTERTVIGALRGRYQFHNEPHAWHNADSQLTLERHPFLKSTFDAVPF